MKKRENIIVDFVSDENCHLSKREKTAVSRSDRGAKIKSQSANVQKPLFMNISCFLIHPIAIAQDERGHKMKFRAN